MQLGVLTTNGGPHPPEKWARVTAWQITNHLVQVDERAASPGAIAVREARDDMERSLYPVLKQYMTTVQSGERAKCQAEGLARLNPAYLEEDRNAAVAEHIDVEAVVSAVADAAKANLVLADHFNKDDVKAQVREIFRKDAGTIIDIERDHLANGQLVGADGLASRNPKHDPDDPAVVLWNKVRHSGFNPGHEAQHEALVARAKLVTA
jgi:hypothetical protein